MNRFGKTKKIIEQHGNDILKSRGMRDGMRYRHHGNVSVFRHSMEVALLSIYIARRFKIDVDERSLIRGALLHDYYLYDWHDPSPEHRLHGFRHANTAFQNARKDFQLNFIESDIIRTHMFPLNLTPPRYRESVIVCIADKISAVTDYGQLIQKISGKRK